MQRTATKSNSIESRLRRLLQRMERSFFEIKWYDAPESTINSLRRMPESLQDEELLLEAAAEAGVSTRDFAIAGFANSFSSHISSHGRWRSSDVWHVSFHAWYTARVVDCVKTPHGWWTTKSGAGTKPGHLGDINAKNVFLLELLSSSGFFVL